MKSRVLQLYSGEVGRIVNLGVRTFQGDKSRFLILIRRMRGARCMRGGVGEDLSNSFLVKRSIIDIDIDVKLDACPTLKGSRRALVRRTSVSVFGSGVEGMRENVDYKS